MSALAKEVAQAQVVNDVHCWACYERGRFEEDCVRCGGTNRMDVDRYHEIIHESLSDAIRGRPLPGWFVPGVYAFGNDSDAYLVRGDRSVVFLTEELLDEAWQIEHKPKFRFFDWLMGIILPIREAA